MKYRFDVDGLRALSVIIVIFNHLGISAFGGGFVGVDVFFVISGYVITRTIAKEAEDGAFSMLNFYERRIRRLLPGLFSIITLAVLAAWLMMLPKDYEALNTSIFSVAVAASNILFWKQAGYFDEMSITKPMLHTWSLAVEEQFYLIYPLIFVQLHRIRRRWLVPVLCLIGLGSLALAINGAYNHPNSTFYLMPTRFWEMLIGGLTFLTWSRYRPSQRIATVLTYGGLALIGIATIFYSGRTPFPGLAALLPTVGAVGFILGGQSDHKTLAFSAFSWKPVVFTGKISYLLYLTHWPLIVFVTYYRISGLGILDKVFVIVASALISTGIYYCIENPFRTKKILFRRPHAFASAALFMSFCGLLAYATHAYQGFPKRFAAKLAGIDVAPDEAILNNTLMKGVIPIEGGVRLTTGHVDPNAVKTFGDGPADIAVFGDSHAGHLVDGFLAEAPAQHHAVKFFINYCSPPALNLSSWNPGGEKYNEQVVTLLCEDPHIKIIVMSANWTMYLKGAPYLAKQTGLLQFQGNNVPPGAAEEIFAKQLAITLKRFRAAGKTVFILEPLPEYKYNVLRTLQLCTLYNRSWHEYLDTSREAYLSRHGATIALLNRVARESDCEIIPSAQPFWSGSAYDISENGASLLTDHHHLSPTGSRRFAHFIFKDYIDSSAGRSRP